MKKLPKCVYKRGPSLFYVKRNKWTWLCAAAAPDDELNRALWRVTTKGSDKLKAVMEDYIVKRLPRRAMTTQKEYERVIRKHLIPSFGHMRPGDLTQQDVAAYLEHWENAGHGPHGNRVAAVLSSVYNHGLRIRACQFNPCYGVRRNEEDSRTRYVTDLELRTALRAAGPALRYLIWATYLTGFRQGDMRRLTKADITPDGIRVMQSKDGKHEIRLWTESLRKVVRRALERSQCDYVFTNSYGRGWTKDSIGLAMTRLKAKTGADWHFHDLRAKADSDHKTGLGLMRRYNRAKRLKAVK